ncbi:hypothetical protein MRB53_038876 [Persea americana]|nr:hypothetical protein MRB53_038876 [Persea americana]
MEQIQVQQFQLNVQQIIHNDVMRSHNQDSGCCPNGQSCNGAVGAPPSTWQPSTTNYGTYVTTVLVPVPVTVPVTVPAAQPTTQTTYYTPTTTTNNGYNGYCSTLTVQGNGLPTTRAGQCGTILVISEASVLIKRTSVGFVMAISSMLGIILLFG